MTPGGTKMPKAPGEDAVGFRHASLLRALAMLCTLFVFFLAINLMGGALKQITSGSAEGILKSAAHPVVGLILGILATSIIQSSSATTSIVVGMTASGAIGLSTAIPMIMGANIGTTVTNTIVSFAHVRQSGEFSRALAAGTVHDFFNIMAVAILFPLELATGIIARCAVWLKATVIGESFGKVPGLKDAIKPIVKEVQAFLHYPGVSLVFALIVLILSLTLMVKIMRALFLSRMAVALDRFLFRNAFSAFVVGALFTVLVQSSSVTTSLVVPFVGAGLLTLRQIFPYTVGANIGTTITAFLAALAIASVEGTETAQIGVTVAVVHLLFNVFGIVLIYPIRAVPIWLAEHLGRYMSVSRKRIVGFALVYTLVYVGPLLGFLLFG